MHPIKKTEYGETATHAHTLQIRGATSKLF